VVAMLRAAGRLRRAAGRVRRAPRRVHAAGSLTPRRSGKRGQPSSGISYQSAL
jgi:hypothetical protein